MTYTVNRKMLRKVYINDTAIVGMHHVVFTRVL